MMQPVALTGWLLLFWSTFLYTPNCYMPVSNICNVSYTFSLPFYYPTISAFNQHCVNFSIMQYVDIMLSRLLSYGFRVRNSNWPTDWYPTTSSDVAVTTGLQLQYATAGAGLMASLGFPLHIYLLHKSVLNWFAVFRVDWLRWPAAALWWSGEAKQDLRIIRWDYTCW